MTKLAETKSVLAKLLASENISVSHQQIPTAYFDLKSRTLVCPVWQDMDGDLYDLLMGHEVGHALETPPEGWHDAIEKNKEYSHFKTFLNVIEDARIEKKVKRKFPGLGKSFASAYSQLYNRDFFGIKSLEDPSKLTLIDRINIRFKMGQHVIVSFNDEERKIVKEVEDVETWDQVVDIAKRIFEYTKKNEKDKIQTPDELEEFLDKLKNSSFDADGEFSETDDDEGDEFSNSERQESDEFRDRSNGLNGGRRNSEKKESSDNPVSITDNAFRSREQELVNSTGVVHMLCMPKTNLDKIVIKNNLFVDRFEKAINSSLSDPTTIYGSAGISYSKLSQKCIRIFNKKNQKFVMHILKEFEMRKKATQYARTQIAKTGELDMSVLHKYKFSNDLFKKIAVVGKGKNHGMILFLDMSGSMHTIMRNTVEQLLVLVSFCKKANIPFDVYGFSDDSRSSTSGGVNQIDKFSRNPDEFLSTNEYNFHLQHLISSSLSSKQYARSFAALAIVANEYQRYTSNYYQTRGKDEDFGDIHTWNESGFSLDSTPFTETLVASRKIIDNFKKKHRCDIVNVLYLTDGCGTSSFQFPPGFLPSGVSQYNLGWNKMAVYIVDRETKKKVRVIGSNVQGALTKLVREVTNCRHIGFYLVEKRYLSQIVKERSDRTHWEINRKSIRDNGFFSSPSIGYDNYFYMQSSDTNIADDELDIDNSMTKNKMYSVFKKNQQSKRSNRVLVSKFAEEISGAA